MKLRTYEIVLVDEPNPVTYIAHSFRINNGSLIVYTFRDDEWTPYAAYAPEAWISVNEMLGGDDFLTRQGVINR